MFDMVNVVLEKIYGAADFAAAAFLLFGGVPAPALLLQACAVVLGIKGLMSFVPIPLYMPSLLMCGADILAAFLLFFGNIAFVVKAALIFILFFKAVPALVFSILEK